MMLAGGERGPLRPISEWVLIMIPTTGDNNNSNEIVSIPHWSEDDSTICISLSLSLKRTLHLNRLAESTTTLPNGGKKKLTQSPTHPLGHANPGHASTSRRVV